MEEETIKSYTDLPQSRKLSEILPLESADMQWIIDDLGESFPFPINDRVNENEEPCWSLAALLDVLPKYELYNFGDTIQLDVNREALATEGDETLLDLVVNMIIHLYEIKVL